MFAPDDAEALAERVRNGTYLTTLTAAVAAELGGITRHYGNLQCGPCADALKAALLAKGISGETIVMRYTGGNGNIISNTVGGSTAISENGTHIGTLVDGIVFDNIHKDGIPLQQWLDDFDALGTRVLEHIPF